MGMTNAFANAALTSLTGNQWLALHNSDPGVTGLPNTESSGGGYARQSITYTAPSNRTTANSNTITFSNLDAQTVTHFAIWSTSVGGTAQFTIALASPITVSSGGTIVIPVNDITITLN